MLAPLQQAAADHGHAELAVTLLRRTDFPGRGYMVGRVAARWGVDAAGRAWTELSLPDGLPAQVQLPGSDPVLVVTGGVHRFAGP